MFSDTTHKNYFYNKKKTLVVESRTCQLRKEHNNNKFIRDV